MSTGAALPIGSGIGADEMLPPGPVVRMTKEPIRGTAVVSESRVAFKAAKVSDTTIGVPVGLTLLTAISVVVNAVGKGWPSNRISVFAVRGDPVTVRSFAPLPVTMAFGSMDVIVGTIRVAAKSFPRLLSSAIVTASEDGLKE